MWRRRTAGVAMAVALTVAVAACGSGGKDKSSYLSSAQIATLHHIVAEATAVPRFVSPGPMIDITRVRGMKLMAIPLASRLPACEQTAHDVVRLAAQVGMSGTVLDNDGATSSWSAGIQQAISQHYHAIVLVCGIDPNLVKAQLTAARDAGIAVIDSGLYDSTVDGAKTSPVVTAQTNTPSYDAMRGAIAYMLLRNEAAPFDIFEIRSDDVPAGVVMDRAIRTMVGQYCPKCRITSTDVPVPNWSRDIPAAVTAGLRADQRIRAVVPIFDGQAPAAAAAIRRTGVSGVKLYGDYGGTPAYISQMGAKRLPMADDVGPMPLWRAYAALDQTLRVLSQQGAVAPQRESDPSRLFTPDNAKAFTHAHGGFGTAFVTGYRKLWGLS